MGGTIIGTMSWHTSCNVQCAGNAQSGARGNAGAHAEIAQYKPPYVTSRSMLMFGPRGTPSSCWRCPNMLPNMPEGGTWWGHVVGAWAQGYGIQRPFNKTSV